MLRNLNRQLPRRTQNQRHTPGIFFSFYDTVGEGLQDGEAECEGFAGALFFRQIMWMLSFGGEEGRRRYENTDRFGGTDEIMVAGEGYWEGF